MSERTRLDMSSVSVTSSGGDAAVITFPFRTTVTIHSLPVEILLNIFTFYVRWSEGDWRGPSPYSSTPAVSDKDTDIALRPVLLSHVCRAWRRAVLQTSTLWTCLPFHISHALSVIAHRSQEQPLDIVHVTKPQGSTSGTAPSALVLPGVDEVFDSTFEKALNDTGASGRWRKVLWESSEAKMHDILSVLGGSTPFESFYRRARVGGEVGFLRRPRYPLHLSSERQEHRKGRVGLRCPAVREH